MTRLMITGARGQLGSELLAAAAVAGLPADGYGSGELDITDAAEVESTVARFAAGGDQPVVINAAAYTAVDAAESDAERAFAVNERGAGLIATAAARHGARLIHLSTDYVFAGDATEPYEIDDPTGPRSVYGASKLAGERAVLAAHPSATVVRTAWVYGAVGANFVKTMAALEATRDTVSVVDDQLGSPTWSADLAGGLVALADAGPAGGILHATGGGVTSWFGLARAVFSELGADPQRVLPTSSAEFVRPAPRPAYSVLSPRSWAAAGMPALPDWRVALAEAFRRHGETFRSPRVS